MEKIKIKFAVLRVGYARNKIITRTGIVNGNYKVFTEMIEEYSEDIMREYGAGTQIKVKSVTTAYHKASDDLRDALKEDILERYDNVEYHDNDVIINFIHENSESPEYVREALTELGYLPTKDKDITSALDGIVKYGAL